MLARQCKKRTPPPFWAQTLNFNAADLVAPLVSPTAPTPLRVYNATPFGGLMPGYDRLEVGNLDLGIRQVLPQAFSSALNASALTLDAEFGLKQVYNMPSDLRFGRSDVFGQGPVAGFTCAAPTPQQTAIQCTQAGYVSSNAYGTRLNAALTYDNVFIPGLKLTPSIGLIWDMSGWSYDGIFNQGRVAMPLRLRADYGLLQARRELSRHPAYRQRSILCDVSTIEDEAYGQSRNHE